MSEQANTGGEPFLRVDEGERGAGSERIEQAEPVVETVPDDETTEEEGREFRAGHRADRPPSQEEEAAADAHGPLDPHVAARAREASQLGANVKGEGQI
jgi:hypothetical protein